MLAKKSRSMSRSAVPGALLALLIVSTLALPVGEVDRVWAATVADSQAATTQPASLLPAASNLYLTPFELSFRVDAKSLALYSAPSLTGAAGRSWKELSLITPGKSALPRFNTPPLFDNSSNGQQLTESAQTKPKHGVRKKYLALGILGVLGPAGGAVAVAGSNSVCTTSNIGNNGTAKSVCSSVHTAGEVMIPAGAAVAVLGFYLAYRHRR